MLDKIARRHYNKPAPGQTLPLPPRMNADPASDPPSEPAGSSAQPTGAPIPVEGRESAMDAPRFPTQKRRHRKPEDEIVVEDNEDALVREVLRKVRESKQQSETTDAARGNTINRFLRRGAGTPVGSNDGPARAVSAAPTVPGAPAPATVVSGAAPEFKPRSPAVDATDIPDQNRSEWAQIFLSYAVVILLVLIAFMVGRYAGRRADSKAGSAPDAARSSQWLPADYDKLAEARAAEHAGDLKTALRITNDLAKHVELGPAQRAFRATLNTRLGHVNDVKPDLAPLLDPNTPPDVSATVNTALAFNYVRCRQFDLAFGCFAAVAKADPFDVPNLIHWGDTLRRDGMLAAAADKFQEALSLLPTSASPSVEAQREYIAYERRLSQVEDGHEADLKAELDQRLSAPMPSGYWLLTAAAAAMQNGNMPEAVEALTKAQTVLSPELLKALLRDNFFQSFAYHRELSAFLIPLSQEQRQAQRLTMNYFVDQ